jgi:2-oxopent-4-enoate hydratase
MIDVQQLARTLRDAEHTCVPCDRLSDATAMTMAQAYAVQQVNIDARVAGGARIIGRKIGITSKAVMEWLKVDQPDFGALLSDMMVADGGVIARSSLLQPRVEGEIAFVLKRDLRGEHITAVDVAAATDHVCAAIEVIDSRVRDWQITITDTIADNASSSRFVLSGQRAQLGAADLALVGCALRVNGRVRSTGAGAACLGHPVQAVVWLANALQRVGHPLRAGDVVLSGALGPVVPVHAGDHIEVDVHGVGSCSVRFA